MRQVNQTITDAIVLSTGHNQGGRLTCYRSRIYSDTISSDYAPSHAKAIGYTGIRLNEASFLLDTESYTPTIITAYVTDENKLYIMRQGNATPVELKTNVDVKSRIGFNANNDTQVYSLYYYNLTSNQWEYQHINITSLMAGSTCLTGVVTSFPALARGSIYPLQGTLNTFVLLEIYEGGVRAGIYDDNKDTIPNVYRFMNPLVALDVATDDSSILHKAGAVLVNNKVYVYFTAYDGSVRSMICTLKADMRHGVWSDIRVSIPQDLSVFSITNVFAYENRIFIAGNFSRTEQFSTITVYALLVWSDDGLTFTMNRRVLCSSIYLPFCVHTNGTEVFFAATNRIFSSPAPYQVMGEDAENTVVTIVNISGSIGGEISVTLAAGAEQYFDDPNIDTGTYAKLELSILTAAGREYLKYFDCVISGIYKEMRDGARGNQLALVADASWHTSSMAQPFYMEFQGKQTVFDRAKDFGNMYKASSGISPEWSLSCDFWAAHGQAFSIQTHNNTTTRHWTKDLRDYYQEYPVFGVISNYQIKVYGWSRAGVPTAVPNVADSTPSTTLNDDFWPVIEYEDAGGVRHIIVLDASNLVAPSHSHPPQTYFETHAGSYPAIFSFPNPGEDFKITHLGVDVHSRSASNTTYYLERIEMPGISVSLIVDELGDSTFEMNNYSHTVNGTPVTTNYFVNKRKGIPQLLFSTRPYSAWNFETTARVRFKGEFSEIGLLGLGTDEKNFIAGFITKNTVCLVQMLRGKRTLLQSITTTINMDTKYDVRLWHRDGLIGFEYKAVSTVVWPQRGTQILYEWQASDGPLAIVDDVYHVGVYSYINSPRFRITGMQVGETIVAALPDDAKNVGLFPVSGKVDIGGTIYNYTGRTSHFIETQGRGPYQIKNIGTYNYPYNKDFDDTFNYQGGPSIEISAHADLPGSTNANDFSGAIIASTNGHAWINEQTQWRPWTMVNGINVQYNDQVRLYSQALNLQTANLNDRIYITDGLTGLSAVDQAEEDNAIKEAKEMNSYLRCPGVFAYYHNNDEIDVYGFQATSGDHDQTIHQLIGVFSTLAGTHARFLGDRTTSQVINNGSEVTL